MALELLYNWWVAPGIYPAQEYKDHNALNIYAYLKAQGWTDSAIAGAVGNFEIESRMNPGYFQNHPFSDWPDNDRALRFSGGFGLAQWTPASTKYFQWAITQLGADYRNGWLQCYRLTLTKGLWHSESVGGMTFQQYTHSTKTPEELSRIWCKAYERPSAPDYNARKNAARYYADLFAATPESALPPVPENPIFPDVPTPPPPPGPSPDPEEYHTPPIWLLFKMKERSVRIWK